MVTGSQSRRASELQAFADVFPNANYILSHNLLTRNPEPDPQAQARQDREALRVVERWLADPRFASVWPALATTRRRLAVFVEQASWAPSPP